MKKIIFIIGMFISYHSLQAQPEASFSKLDPYKYKKLVRTIETMVKSGMPPEKILDMIKEEKVLLDPISIGMIILTVGVGMGVMAAIIIPLCCCSENPLIVDCKELEAGMAGDVALEPRT